MKCFHFCSGQKKEEAKTPKPARSSVTGREPRKSNSRDGPDNRADFGGHSRHPNLSERPSNLKVFTLLELKQITRNFSNSAKLGEGGFGCVFKGVIKNSEDPARKIDVAIKQLGKQGQQVQSLTHSPFLTQLFFLCRFSLDACGTVGGYRQFLFTDSYDLRISLCVNGFCDILGYFELVPFQKDGVTIVSGCRFCSLLNADSFMADCRHIN